MSSLSALLGKGPRFKKLSEIQANLGTAEGAAKPASQEAGISP